jgi:CRISPR-associated protein Csm1
LPAGVAALPRELANYVPTENGQVITFDEIARLSRGIKRLGLLKADVDNLGKIFAFGLKRDDQSLDSISRMSTLSRMLDHFFSGCVNALLKDNYPTCYTVYSGGDDLVIIGPWDQVVGLAAELQARFRQFVADNSNITISAGIAMTRSRSPVNKAIEAAETMLELSKEKENPFTGKNRNQISIYRKNMTWESFSVIIGEGERLAGWAGGKKISSSELRNLKQYDLLYIDYIDHNNVQGLLYKAFLAYQLGRMKKEGKTDSVVLRWHEELLGETDAKLENLGPAVDYALSIIREGDY